MCPIQRPYIHTFIKESVFSYGLFDDEQTTGNIPYMLRNKNTRVIIEMSPSYDPILVLPNNRYTIHAAPTPRQPTSPPAMSAYIPGPRQSRVLLAVHSVVITGLWVDSNAPVAVGEPLILTAHIASGTNVLYRFVHVGQPAVDVVSSDPVYTVTFSKSGIFTFEVHAYNDVSRQDTTVYVSVVTGGNVIDIEGPCCVAVDEEFTLVAGEHSYFTDSLHYTWVFEGSTTLSGLGLHSVVYQFTKAGIHTVDVSIRSMIGFSAEAHSTILVQVPVQGVVLVAPSVITHTPNGVSSVPIQATVQTGTDYIFHWNVDPNFNGDQPNNASQWIFNSTKAGVFNISVTLSNRVSAVERSALLHIQERITDLRIVANGSVLAEYYERGTTYLFQALCTGTEIDYTWRISPSPGFMTINGNSLLVHFAISKMYNIKVTASNTVSGKVQKNEKVTILDPVSDVVLISSATVVLRGEPARYQVGYRGHGPSRIRWEICLDGCVPIDSEELLMTLVVNRTGVHNVCVSISNPVGFEKECVLTNVVEELWMLDLCIYEYHPVIYLATWTLYEFVACDPYNESASLTLYKYESQSTVLHSSDDHTMKHAFVAKGRYVLITEFLNSTRSTRKEQILILQDIISDVHLRSAVNGTINENMMFQLAMSTGSDFQMAWQIRNAAHRLISYELKNESDFEYIFLRGGTYDVFVFVYNYISSSTVSFQVHIEAPADDLAIVSDSPTFPFLPMDKAIRFTYTNHIRGRIDHIEWAVHEESGITFHNYAAFSHLFSSKGTPNIILSLTINGLKYVTNETLVIQQAAVGINITHNSPYVSVGNSVQFGCIYAQGTDLKFMWNTSASPLIAGPKYITTFLQPGPITVQVVAYNNVSEVIAQLSTIVLERITGVRVSNCCSRVIPTNTEWIFKACITSGNDVYFMWTIDDNLIPSHNDTLKYIFTSEGQHNISVNCSNAMSWSSIHGVVDVQDTIKAVQIIIDNNVLVGQTVPVIAETPECQCRSITAEWFVNGIRVASTKYPYYQIGFRNAGSFNISVLVKNDISSSANSIIVTAHNLGCALPTLQVIGSSNRVYYKSDSILIQMSIKSTCDQYSLSYYWSITSNVCSTPGHPISLSPEVKVTSPSLGIHPMTLEYGQYCCKLTLNLLGSPSTVLVTETVSYRLTYLTIFRIIV